MSTAVYRIWLGWRQPALAFEKFREHLENTFAPATWQVMGEFGLQAYLPTLLPDGSAAEIPHETALLIYESKTKYDEAFKTPAGRAYGLLHQSVFKSPFRGGWAVAPGQPRDGKVDAFLWPAAYGAGLASRKHPVVFLLLHHPATPALEASAVRAALGQDIDETVVCREAAFSFVWLATPNKGGAAAVKAELARAQPDWLCLSAHDAALTDCDKNGFVPLGTPIVLPPDHTLFFTL